MFNRLVEKTYKLGKFEVTSGKLRVSDPCYSPNTWCSGVLNRVKKGTWYAETTMGECWGMRNTSLVIRHESVDKIEDLPMPMWKRGKFTAGVDSGQCGFFDVDCYQKGELIKKDPKFDASCGDGDGKPMVDRFYNTCCDITLADRGAGIVPGGAVARSGVGDGTYPCLYFRKGGVVIAAMLIFITDDEDDEDEDE